MPLAAPVMTTVAPRSSLIPSGMFHLLGGHDTFGAKALERRTNERAVIFVVRVKAGSHVLADPAKEDALRDGIHHAFLTLIARHLTKAAELAHRIAERHAFLLE